MPNYDQIDELVYGNERARIEGVRFPPPPEGSPYSVTVHTMEASDIVLSRAKEVLVCMLKNLPSDWPDNETTPWPSLDTWERVLPRWFVDACDPETTEEKLDARHRRFARLPPEHREIVRLHEAVSLGTWTSMFETYRSWLWWRDSILSSNLFRVQYIAFEEQHTKWDLGWLFMASGAWNVEFSEDENWDT